MPDTAVQHPRKTQLTCPIQHSAKHQISKFRRVFRGIYICGVVHSSLHRSGSSKSCRPRYKYIQTKNNAPFLFPVLPRPRHDPKTSAVRVLTKHLRVTNFLPEFLLLFKRLTEFSHSFAAWIFVAHSASTQSSFMPTSVLTTTLPGCFRSRGSRAGCTQSACGHDEDCVEAKCATRIHAASECEFI